MLEAIGTVKAGIDILSALAPWLGKAKDLPARRLEAEIVDALRTVYFFPSGILLTLNEIAEGRNPSEEEMRRARDSFSAGDASVAPALLALASGELEHNKRLSLGAVSELQAIAYGKKSVRREVAEFIADPAAPTRSERARELAEQITALNKQVVELESAFNRSVEK